MGKSVLVCFQMSVVTLCCLMMINSYASSLSEISVLDDIGHTVTLKQPAKRIISLAPHVTELLFAAGAGEQVVGVVSYSDFPEAAKKLPQVGAYNAFDLEAIVALKPDLIVAWESTNPAGALEKLQSMAIPVFYSEPRLLEDVATNLERLGQLTGNEEVANRASRAYRKNLAKLRAQYSGKKHVSVFYQIWHQPLMTINGEHIISQVINLCGGRNVFFSQQILAPKISLESVLQENPEVVVAGNSALNHPNWKDDWKKWPSLKAVKNDHLFYINPDIIQRHTPRILQGADVLCQQLESVRAKFSVPVK